MSTADEIAKLHDLLTKGAITQEEFDQAKARLLGSPAPASWEINRFRRAEADRWIAGVCGGIAKITGVDAWAWRLIFALATFIGGTGAILYVLLWIFVPTEGEPT